MKNNKLRIALIVLTCIVLFVSLFLGNIFLTIGSSMEYSIIKPEISGIAQKLISQEKEIDKGLEEAIPLMQSYCNSHNTTKNPLTKDAEEIPCQIVLNGKEETSDYLKEEAGIEKETLETNLLSDEEYSFLKDHCESHKEFIVEKELIPEDENVLNSNLPEKIPCENINKGKESVINYSVDEITKEVYYKDYDCDFFYCFEQEQEPLFLISEKAKSHWFSWFFISLFFSVVFIGVIFLLLEKKYKIGYVIGGLIILSSIPLVLYKVFINLFTDIFIGVISLPETLSDIIVNVLMVFFSQSLKIFWISFSIGILLIILGFIFSKINKKK